MNIFKDSIYIAQKDLREFTRSKLRMVMLILMPLLMMVMTGYIFPSQNTLKNLPIGLAIEDQSPAAQQVVNILNQVNDQQHFFKFQDMASLDEGKNLIDQGKIKGGLIIPQDFSQKIQNNEQAEVIILQDDTNPQISLMVSSVLSGVLTSAAEGMGAINVQKTIIAIAPQQAPKNPLAFVKPFIAKIQGTINGNANYFQFMAPGIMMMVVLMSIMTGLPHAISYEREIGTMDGMMAAPISPLAIIGGKTIAQTVRGLAQATIILLLAIFLFKVHIYGSLALVFLLIVLGVFSFIGLGITLTSIAKDQEGAAMMTATFMFPMMFLSGIFFPLDQMPHFMQIISHALPLTYAADALRKVITLGVPIQTVSMDMIILAAFGAVMLIIAVPLFRRMMTR